MKAAAVLEKRRTQWKELERLCDALDVSGKAKKSAQENHQGAPGISRFASLYRAACADLALADSYQLPPGTVTYLHRLVARAHSQLYRGGKINPSTWVDVLFRDAPKAIFADPCVRVASLLFFGLFTVSIILAANESWFPGFAVQVLGQSHLDQLEEMYDRPLFSTVDSTSSIDHYVSMSSFYIAHNTGIGLRCFAFGILILPCLFTLAFNAVNLGASFGFMARPDVSGSDNFFQFVTAHGPFELTAIALAAAAGLRMGMGWFSTEGLNRIDSLRINAIKAVPIMAASAALFVAAAFTEGFISPSPLPYLFKAVWAILSSGLISFYFVVLGFPRETSGLQPSGVHGNPSWRPRSQRDGGGVAA